MLAVSVLAAIANLRLIFEDDYLLAAAIAIYHGQYPGAFDSRLADGYVIAIADKQHPVQLYRTALFHLQAFYLNGITFGDLILFAACFNNSVNFKPPKNILYQFYS